MRELFKPEVAADDVPGEAGVWLIIFGEMIIFALLFVSFALDRSHNATLFAAGAALLHHSYGLVNLFLMLSSSLFVAFAVNSIREDKTTNARRLLGTAFLCGLGFAAVKFLEYREKVEAGITMSTDQFFMYYYVLTGLHLFHVFIGMVILVVLMRYASKAQFGPAKIRNTESGACYWHMVDMLWIVIFALFYVIR